LSTVEIAKHEEATEDDDDICNRHKDGGHGGKERQRMIKPTCSTAGCAGEVQEIM
jgi:hypothetical protein